mmetsp:Transcript_52815/g.118513  ORF Transcript_52815/g.118513 Transcript_52815/m.118513 type:complete len:219 (-) Transcript_52815:39-695(-)
MLQTMQVQEDLYNLSKHYFSHLSARLDVISAAVHLGDRSSTPAVSHQSSLHSNMDAVGFRAVAKGDVDLYEHPRSSPKPLVHLSGQVRAQGPQSPREWLDLQSKNEWRKLEEEPLEMESGVRGLEALLESAVRRVELSMIEMESRLRYSSPGLPVDVQRTAERHGMGESADWPQRKALFRSVYGKDSPPARSSRRGSGKAGTSNFHAGRSATHNVILR